MWLVMSTETLNMAIMREDMSRARASLLQIIATDDKFRDFECTFYFPEKWTKCVMYREWIILFHPPYVIKLSNIGSEAIKAESNWILGSALLSSVSGLIFLGNWCCFGSKIFHILLPAINSSRTRPKLSFVTTPELLIWRKWTWSQGELEGGRNWL